METCFCLGEITAYMSQIVTMQKAKIRAYFAAKGQSLLRLIHDELHIDII